MLPTFQGWKFFPTYRNMYCHKTADHILSSYRRSSLAFIGNNVLNTASLIRRLIHGQNTCELCDSAEIFTASTIILRNMEHQVLSLEFSILLFTLRVSCNNHYQSKRVNVFLSGSLSMVLSFVSKETKWKLLNATVVYGIEMYASFPLPCPSLMEKCRAAQLNICRKLHSLWRRPCSVL